MSTMHVTVENGKLMNNEYVWSEASNQYVQHTTYCTEMLVNYNWCYPWHVMVADGKIVCHCEANYSIGFREQNRVLPLKDGTLILSGGEIGNRYVGFRNKEFSNWLEENRITQVNKDVLDKNGYMKITLRSARCSSGSAAHILVTDGDVDYSSEEVEYMKNYEGFYCGDSIVRYEITGASYILVYEEMHYNDNHNGARTLYVKPGFDPTRLGNFFKKFPKHIQEELKKFRCDGSGYHYEYVEI